MAKKKTAKRTKKKESIFADQNMMLQMLGLGASVCICAVMSFTAYQDVKRTDSYVANSEARERELTLQLNELKTEEPVDAQEISVQLASAADQGEKLADLQNQFKTISTDNKQQLQSVSEQMSGLLGEDDQDKAVIWYANDGAKADPEWKFMTTYAFSADSMDVIWLCRNAEQPSEILAYATGVYNTDDNTFSNLKWYQTSMGTWAEDGQDSDTDRILSIVDKINELPPAPDMEIAEEDMAVIGDARGALRDANTD